MKNQKTIVITYTLKNRNKKINTPKKKSPRGDFFDIINLYKNLF